MVNIVLTSHGELAGGVKQAASMVFGSIEGVPVVSLSPQDGPESFRARLDEAVASLGTPEHLLFLADLWGGTPFNQSKLACDEHEDWVVVTGLSLPVFIEAYSNLDAVETASELAAHIFEVGRQGIRISPERLEP